MYAIYFDAEKIYKLNERVALHSSSLAELNLLYILILMSPHLIDEVLNIPKTYWCVTKPTSATLRIRFNMMK